MGERKTKQQLEKIKNKYNVSELWSWSKYNTYKTDPFGYYLKYILKEKETKHSIWGISGSNCHDILERFYNKEIEYKDMLPEYEQKLFEMNMAELKYHRKDAKLNDNMANKYEDCMRLFFQQHIPVEGKVIIEQFVIIKIGKNIFQGYLDFIHKDDEGNYIITDFKTSTIYTGKKIEKERGQLVLYAESLIQKGIPLKNIKIRWNFLKYCTITYQLKGKDKETKLNKTKQGNYERNAWVDGIKTNLKMWLVNLDQYDGLEIDEMVDVAVNNNNLDNIPQDIQSKYKMEDCYVYIPLNQEIIDDLKQDIIDTIDEIKMNEKSYETTQNNKIWWTEIDKSNEFYFANLCGYPPSKHLPYKEYLDDLNLFVKDKQDDDEIDDSWLDELD